MLLSLTRLKMADVDVEGLSSMSAIALTAVVGAVVLLLVFLCNFVKKGFEKSRTDTQGTSLTVTQIVRHPLSTMHTTVYSCSGVTRETRGPLDISFPTLPPCLPSFSLTFSSPSPLFPHPLPYLIVLSLPLEVEPLKAMSLSDKTVSIDGFC